MVEFLPSASRGTQNETETHAECKPHGEVGASRGVERTRGALNSEALKKAKKGEADTRICILDWGSRPPSRVSRCAQHLQAYTNGWGCPN